MSELPGYPEALARALESAVSLGAEEDVAIADAGGRVLRETIVADRDLPPFNRAQMDGYALRAAEVGSLDAWAVVHTIAAGQGADVAVPPGQCVAIATGAPLPADVDAVVPHERTDRGNPVRLEINALDAGAAVHPRGADAAAGDPLMTPGTLLRAHHLGIAATVGRTSVRVAQRPRVVILTSGDEIRSAGETPAPHQIRNSNGPQTLELVTRFGAEPIAHEHVIDEREPTIEAVGRAIAAADLVITIGGISAGDRDHFPTAFDAHGVTRSLVGARIQPGKPIVTGRASGGAVVIGLPGNPVSSLVCACLFVWPIVRRQLDLDPALRWRGVLLAAPVRPNPRRQAFRPAALDADGCARVPAWAGSGDLAHTAATDGFIELPVQPDEVRAGATVRFLDWP